MIDTARTSDEAEAQRGQPLFAVPAELEQRIRRLEDAVAGLQDTRQLEDRVVERVGRLRADSARDGANRMVLENRKLLPAVEVIPSPAGNSPPPHPAPPRAGLLGTTFFFLEI